MKTYQVHAYPRTSYSPAHRHSGKRALHKMGAFAKERSLLSHPISAGLGLLGLIFNRRSR